MNDEYGDIGTWCPEVWDNITVRGDIKSVADIGCGKGYAARYFDQRGLYAIGVEGDKETIRNAVFRRIIKNDYTKSSAFGDEQFDLIWSCEFVEHVEEQYIDNFLNDFRKGKYIAMTHAIPGQSGDHHVNCQLAQYWIDRMKDIEFWLNGMVTNKLRKIAMETSESLSFPHGMHLMRLLFFEKEW